MNFSICIFFFVFFFQSAHGQLWDELFRQRKTQRKYLLKQIVLLKTYDELLQEGYKVVKGGLTFIGDVSKGHFDLDRNYFTSLSTVGQAVYDDWRIKAIYKMEMEIGGQVYTTNRAINEITEILPDFKESITKSLSNSISKYRTIVQDVTEFVTNEYYSMSDQSRVTHIDHLYSEALQLWRYVLDYCQQVKIFAVQNRREKGNVEVIKKLYGTKTKP